MSNSCKLSMDENLVRMCVPCPDGKCGVPMDYLGEIVMPLLRIATALEKIEERHV